MVNKTTIKLIALGLIPFIFFQTTIILAVEIGEVQGRITNQSQNNSGGSDLSVTLHVFKQDESLETFTANTDSLGQFSLQKVPISKDNRYIISTNYQTIEYAKEVPIHELKDSLNLSIFDTTESLKALSIDSHLWFIKDVDPKARHILITEIVMVNNKENLVFAPNLRDPSKMNFLRFSLPIGFSNLHLETDIGRDNVLDVGTGFGMTSPIPPGMHQIIFTYTVPYEKDQLTMTRRFLQEIDILQVLFPANQGSMFSPNLEEIEPAIISDINYSTWATQNIGAGSTVVVNLTNLSEPSFAQMLFSGVRATKYLTIAIPLTLGLILLITLITISLRPLSTALGKLNTLNEPPLNNLESNSSLLYDIAYLDSTFGLKTMSENQYLDLRSRLMTFLVLRLERQELLSSGLYENE